MNMRTTLTEDELLAQRAARTGRRAPTGAPGAPEPPPEPPPADPGAARPTLPSRSPFLDMLPPDADGVGDDAPTGVDDAGGTPPANQNPVNQTALQQQLNAALGRVAPLQQTVDQLRATVESLQTANAQLQAQAQAAAQAQSAAQARQTAEQFDPFANVSADDLALLDPAVVKAIRTSTQASLAQALSNTQDPQVLITQALQQRDERARQSYIRAKAQELNLVALGNDARFQQFLANDDSAEILLNSFVQAADLEAARYLEPRVRTMIKRFEKTVAAPGNKPADPQDRLTAHLSRSGESAPATPGPGHRKELTPERVKQIRMQASRLQRQRQFKAADELLAQLN